MSRYKYIMRDYHAIENAEIELDGITVLSGVNGCGKSTLSRWLYYIVNGAVNLERYLVVDDYGGKLWKKMEDWRVACMELGRGRVSDNPMDSAANRIQQVKGKFMQVVSGELDGMIEEMQELYLDALAFTEECLSGLDDEMPKERVERVLKFLDIHIGSDLTLSIALFSQKEREQLQKETEALHQKLGNRPRKLLFEFVQQRFPMDEGVPEELQLEEDSVGIMEQDTVGRLLNLKDAIYIDTPMAATEDSSNRIWRDLQRRVMDKKHALSPEASSMLEGIGHLIEGEVLMEKNPIGRPDLRYVSKDGQVNIELKQVATGFKTFAYMQRLLENGHLDKNTLLLIDEPEAHLHPQWIVEFARLLVLLNKKLGLKVLLASHNPDMVAALHDIAEKEGVLDTTWFYVAEPSQTSPHQFVYKNLGHEIAEIFKSFNIALDRIKEYGSPGI